MESRLAQVVTKAQAVEKQLNEKLADTATPLEDVIAELKEFRSVTDDIISCDFVHARTAGVETRLWGAHNRLNARLRKQLSKLRKERSSKPVETRKLTKFYLEFLKDSLRYYRLYIQRLNARFGGIAELQRIAHQVKSESTDTTLQDSVSPQIQQQVILSCHQTLIYLGDLFRYRAAEKLDKVPDWGPAIGYYALAASLRPTSGIAYHQQSVVAFEQGDYLRSTYYLYRAIVVDEPHPNAIANLELQFKKITTGWERGELVPKNLPHDKTASRKALVAWFIRFHSICYKGKPFAQYEELEKEVLSRTRSELKTGSLDSVLQKMMFINFAAQTTAASQFQDKPDHPEYMQSYFFFLRLNVKVFITLLEVYRQDLDDLLPHDQTSGLGKKRTNTITEKARHVLPCLRLYSTWLLSNAHIVAAGVGDDLLLQTIANFWTAYASTLSALATAFPFRELPEVGYQLEEDVESFAFKPLESDRTRKLWQTPGTAENKPKFSDADLPRLPLDTEMLARIRELLFDALLLAVDNDVPITFNGSKFIVEDGSSSVTPAVAPQAVTPPTEDLDSQLEKVRITPPAQEQDNSPSAVPQPISGPSSQRQSRPYTREADLKNMVDDLVGAEDDDEQNNPLTPPVQSFEPVPLLNAENGSYYGTSFRNGFYGKGSSPRGIPQTRTPEVRNASESWQPSSSPVGRSSQRLHSVSSIWNELPQTTSPLISNPSGGFGPPRLPPSTPMNITNGFGHSRAHSATSLKSSLPKQDGWSSFEPTPQGVPANNVRYDYRMGSFQGPGSQQQFAGMNSPLLFGAGGGPWSTGPRGSLSNTTPPNGQGG